MMKFDNKVFAILAGIFFGLTNSETNFGTKSKDAIWFEPELDSQKTAKAEKLKQETGFDVAFPGLEPDYKNTQKVGQNFDTGFDGTRPGFSSTIPDTYTENWPKREQASGFPENYPGFEYGEVPRRGFATNYPLGLDSPKPGFSQASPPAIYYDFESQPGYSGQPWFNQRYRRQANLGQTVPAGFDSGFDGTRPGFALDPGFDGTRPGFKPTKPAGFDLDSGFDGTRPGFGRPSRRPGFDSGFDGTRPGFRRPSLDGTRLGRPPRGLRTKPGKARPKRSLSDDVEVLENAGQADGESEKFWFLQPHNKNNLPWVPPNWNYGQMQPYPPVYNNMGSYGPGGNIGPY